MDWLKNYPFTKGQKDQLRFDVETQRSQLLKSLVEEVGGMKKYHKEFECNGANNGKGCYETFCEDQNCRNAPKEYNQALQDVIKLLERFNN